MLDKGTVGIVCDLRWRFFETKLGKSGKSLLSDYEYGMSVCLEKLREMGIRAVLTSLHGYADVCIPYGLIARRHVGWAEGLDVHCLLEKEGDEDELDAAARTVWAKADHRMYATQREDLDSTVSFEETFVSQCSCLLSGTEDPDGNAFHIAAKKLGIPIYHQFPSEYCEFGAKDWQETEAFGNALAKLLKRE